jgi:hypothetical protein
VTLTTFLFRFFGALRPKDFKNYLALMVIQAFLKKWWAESDFKAPNLPLSLRLKGSGCHYNSIYNNTGTK